MNTKKNKRALALAGVALAAGLVLVPAAAQAHVGIESSAPATPGATTTLTFGFGHGCDGSPTTALEIALPEEGISGPQPIAQAGWDIEVTHDGDAGRASSVIYTAEEPIGDEMRGEVRLSVGILSDAEGSLVFPVEQRCVDGSASWSEVAEDGQDPHDLDSPAPVVEIVADGETGSGTGHGGDGSGHGTVGADDAHAEGPAADAGDQALPIALGGAGLLAGVAALAVSIIALRRRS